ncbi:alkaline ceramidase 1 [Sarcophilus harrisii]|uniref:alkaline ceramidase 1 n=1 Tax=Sarcophilus harrisii TaxID=9305 RepID=UPI001301F1B8|nr:alkaline ceramidase 1 [Sarcophilus harrisii]XP_031803612.1 alkaline ceramidase 1 [Sarcophilus harrisii]
MASIFSYQSSEVDWCESNYQHSTLVAEFYNSISNVPFFIIGPLMMYLMHPYAQKRSLIVQLPWVLFMLVGAFSVYFHMTLSFLGQILDELAILWLLATCYCIWFPRCYFPAFLKRNRSHFTYMVLFIAIIITFLAFLKPVVNAYVLNSIALHICYFVKKEYKKKHAQVNHMITVSVLWWLLAVSTWICDRIFCSYWQQINFAYLHSLWHIFISIVFPYVVDVLIILDGRYEMQDNSLEIHYWPRDEWLMGLPYVTFKGEKVNSGGKNC